MLVLLGMNETVLNVECDCSSVCHAVKECWKSLFTRRSIEYRVKNGFPAFDTSIAVIVQVMIPSEVAGVVFTVDPHTSSRAHLALDGVQGIGEALVSGMVVSDHWTIRKPYGDYEFLCGGGHYQSTGIQIAVKLSQRRYFEDYPFRRRGRQA